MLNSKNGGEAISSRTATWALQAVHRLDALVISKKPLPTVVIFVHLDP